jgi:hypothetical protein
MKKLLTAISVFAIASLPLWGQMNISTNLTQNFAWDTETRGWVPSSEEVEDYTFFSFNEEYSMLKHTTSKMTSAYLVKSISKDTLDNDPLLLLDIVSDVGNQYLMIIDINDNTLRFIDEDFTFMKSQSIKNIWTDKEEQ